MSWKRGKYSMEIYQDDKLKSDLEIRKLGLKVELIEGKDYNYYLIS